MIIFFFCLKVGLPAVAEPVCSTEVLPAACAAPSTGRVLPCRLDSTKSRAGADSKLEKKVKVKLSTAAFSALPGLALPLQQPVPVRPYPGKTRRADLANRSTQRSPAGARTPALCAPKHAKERCPGPARSPPHFPGL